MTEPTDARPSEPTHEHDWSERDSAWFRVCRRCGDGEYVDEPAQPVTDDSLEAVLAAALQEAGLWPHYPKFTDVWNKHAREILATPSGSRLRSAGDERDALPWVCAYCGGENHDPDATVADLTAHVEVCPEHPLAAAYRWIVQHPTHGAIDHACAECVPGGDMVVAGFRCVPHRAALSTDTEGGS